MESCSSNLQKNQRISRSCICGHGRKTAMLYEPPFRTGNSCRTFAGLLTDFLFIRFAPFCSFRQQKAKMPQNRDSEAKKAKKMVHPTRFELMTFYSGGRRSIQLSYGCPCHCYIQYSLFSIFKVAVDRNPAFFSIFCVFLCIASKKTPAGEPPRRRFSAGDLI